MYKLNIFRYEMGKKFVISFVNKNLTVAHYVYVVHPWVRRLRCLSLKLGVASLSHLVTICLKVLETLPLIFFCKNWFYVFSLKISIEFSIKKKLLAEKGF